MRRIPFPLDRDLSRSALDLCEVIGSQLDVGHAEVLLEPVELGGAGDRPTSDQRVPSGSSRSKNQGVVRYSILRQHGVERGKTAIALSTIRTALVRSFRFSKTADCVGSLSHFRNDFGCWNFFYPKSVLNFIAGLPMQACSNQECRT